MAAAQDRIPPPSLVSEAPVNKWGSVAKKCAPFSDTHERTGGQADGRTDGQTARFQNPCPVSLKCRWVVREDDRRCVHNGRAARVLASSAVQELDA
jgi:hypothetical protein